MHVHRLYIYALLLLMYSMPGSRFAQAEEVTTLTNCEKSFFSGSWVSTDADVPFLSKLEIKDICKQIVTKPVAVNNPWAGSLGHERKYVYREYTLRPSSSCSPVDCVWGRARGDMDKKGTLKAQFRMFWSQRYLELIRQNDNLVVHWRIEYVGRKKPDQIGKTLLVRAK